MATTRGCLALEVCLQPFPSLQYGDLVFCPSPATYCSGGEGTVCADRQNIVLVGKLAPSGKVKHMGEGYRNSETLGYWEGVGDETQG